MEINWTHTGVSLLVLTLWLTVISAAQGQNTLSLADLENRRVLLTQPHNPEIYYVGHTSLVVTWHPPITYFRHDLIDPHTNEKQKKYQVIPGSYVSMDGSQNEKTAPGESGSTDSGTDTETTTPASKRKCQPLSYFANYTVRLDPVSINDSESMKVVTYISTADSHKRHPVVPWVGQIPVAFEEGCLDHFQVTWEDKLKHMDSGSLNVSATTHTANLTGLKPGVAYTINVVAVYVAGHSLAAKDSIVVTTKQGDDPDTCKCNWTGSMGSKCTLVNDTQRLRCKCKPGYTGAFCQRCLPGYYRATPEHPCHRCPCHSYSSVTPTCTFVEGFLSCDRCHPGYTGNICHRCAPGYHMLRGRCLPCFCNGNTGPDACMCQPVIEKSEKIDTCKLPMDVGELCATVPETVIHFYFDHSAQECKSFMFSGCEGNDNNFATMDDCNNRCVEELHQTASPVLYDNIIIIACGCGTVGLLLLVVLVYCSCCHRSQKDPIMTLDDMYGDARTVNKDSSPYDNPLLYNLAHEEDHGYIKVKM